MSEVFAHDMIDGMVPETQILNRKSPLVPVEELRRRVNYDPQTGLVTWRIAIGTRTRIGDTVGWMNDQGYLKFKIGTAPYYLSRAIWAHTFGYWPNRLVDHRNGVRTDNRLVNLRLATNGQNAHNGKVRRSGLKGATWSIAGGAWAAQICLTKNGQRTNNHLGLFSSEEEAHQAYCKAAVEYFGNFARFE